MGAQSASTGRRSAALLTLLLPLAGCAAMNQVTVLDRLFEPERFGAQPPRPAAAPPRAVAALPPVAAPAAVPPPIAPPAAVAPPASPPAAVAPEIVAPDVATPDTVAMEPLPDPKPVAASRRPAPEDAEARLRQTIRQHPWVTRFWSELTLTEQARIARQLPADDDPPGRWDSMGLADRARLVGTTPDERRWASGR